MIKKKTNKGGLTPPVPSDNQQLSQLKEQLARSRADYLNLEKRVDSQRQMFMVLAVTPILSKMIAVLDDLYLAQDHLADPGLQIAIDKFVTTLKSEGVTEIKARDELFDPVTMDCVDVREGKQDYVVEVRKIGYKLNDQIIRPAQVVVGKVKN